MWITGASSGLGRACAVELARRGARVAVSARRLNRLQALVAELDEQGTEAVAIECDVTDEAQQQAAVAAIVERYGRLDVAIANAGFGVAGKVENLDASAWRRQFDTNVVGVAITARQALPQLRKTKGRLALVGSVAGFFAAPGHSAYHASKHAVRVMGQTLSLELSGSGVSCTTIHPGFVISEIGRVDNNGQFDDSRHDERPSVLLWPTDRAARVMVSAIAKRRREVVFTAHGKLAAFVGRHWPSFMHWAMSRPAMLRQAEAIGAGDDG